MAKKKVPKWQKLKAGPTTSKQTEQKQVLLQNAHRKERTLMEVISVLKKKQKRMKSDKVYLEYTENG